MSRTLCTALLVAVVAGAALLAAGCTGGKPSSGPDGHPSATPSVTARQTGPDVYAACMREHGVTEFPDPGPSGLLRIGPQNVFDTASPQYLEAYEACQALA